MMIVMLLTVGEGGPTHRRIRFWYSDVLAAGTGENANRRREMLLQLGMGKERPMQEMDKESCVFRAQSYADGLEVCMAHGCMVCEDGKWDAKFESPSQQQAGEPGRKQGRRRV
jgi:hypothetical protein